MLRAFLTAVLVAGLCTAMAVPGAGADTGLLPFGCANPAGAGRASLLPAAPGSTQSRVTCFGRAVLGTGSLAPRATAGPVGYSPRQLQVAYRVAGLRSHGRTVAVVDAFDDPNAEADLAVYRQSYGLPACTTANGCFRKVNQNGQGTPLPAHDYGWAEEISLDLDAVSAICPDCHLLLVEAGAPEITPLMTAVDTAVRLGAAAVANSYGGVEDRSILAADAHLNHPGVAITAAAGDDGYGAQWPASSRYVTAVGGTTLRPASTPRGWGETVWRGTGSGCSAYEPKPSWQKDRSCARRTVGDVAAVADPATGLGVYDTYNSCAVAALCDALIRARSAAGLNGWAKIGGTSLAAPIVAAMYALAANKQRASYIYSHTGALYDVRSGANGRCGVSYLCSGRIGYDAPTGFGTPHGIGAF
jgi:subtilase family serine protease